MREARVMGGAGGSGVASEAASLEGHVRTMSDQMQAVLYGPHGYYSSGQVRFKSPKKEGHFTTHATKSSGLALVIVGYLHKVFQAQLADGTRKHGDDTSFVAVELSGGDGSLACDVLTYLYGLAKQEYDVFPDLYKQLSYIIYEISPALAAKQAEKCRPHLDKLVIKNKSALLLDEPRIDFCFSNEFFDALPADRLKVDASGTLLIEVLLPYTPRVLAGQSCRAVLPSGEEIKRDDEHFSYLDVPTLDALEKSLDEEAWRVFASELKYERRFVPLAAFPGLHAVYASSEVVKSMDRGVTHPVSADLIKMTKALSCHRPYCQMHWDYGSYHSGGLRTPMRMYGPDEIAHVPYDGRCGVDITADVDFDLLAVLLDPSKERENTLVGFNAMAFMPIIKGLEAWLSALAQRVEGSDGVFWARMRDDVNKYCLTKASFLFLGVSATMNLCEKDKPVYIPSDNPELYPGCPMNPINLGIPYGRPFVQHPQEPEGYSYMPTADLERSGSWGVLYLPQRLLPDYLQHTPDALERIRRREEQKGERQFKVSQGLTKNSIFARDSISPSAVLFIEANGQPRKSRARAS